MANWEPLEGDTAVIVLSFQQLRSSRDPSNATPVCVAVEARLPFESTDAHAVFEWSNVSAFSTTLLALEPEMRPAIATATTITRHQIIRTLTVPPLSPDHLAEVGTTIRAVDPNGNSYPR